MLQALLAGVASIKAQQTRMNVIGNNLANVNTTAFKSSRATFQDMISQVVRGGYGIFYTHTVRQGREGMLGFNPPYLVDNLLQTGVSGAAVALSPIPAARVSISLAGSPAWLPGTGTATSDSA